MRITFEQKRDLQILGQVMDGHPSRTGLIQTAIDEYVAKKAADPVIGPKYANQLNRPGLKIVD
jgi:hypothetical protein